jgi:hypothetical protein
MTKCQKCNRENIDLWLVSHYAYGKIFAICIRCLAFNKKFKKNHEFLEFIPRTIKKLSRNRLIYQEKTKCID